MSLLDQLDATDRDARALVAGIRAFVREYAGIDLAGTRLRNPLIRGVRLSLATGLHVITAHERRHLWQARKVRQGHSRFRA